MRWRGIAATILFAMLTACAPASTPTIPAPLAQIAIPCPAIVMTTVLWSPDSTHLAYVFDQHPYIQTVLTNERGSANGLNVQAAPFAWSPDGSRLVITNASGAQIIDVEGGDPIDLPRDMYLESYGGSWSPDGSRIAYGRHNAETQRYELALWDARSGAITVIYSEPEDNLLMLHPAWSPDGARIAVLAASGPYGEGYVRIISVDDPQSEIGSIEKKSFLPPAWSPDGKYIATMDWGQDDGIYILSTDGSVRTRLTDTPAATMRWLPDSSGLIAVSLDISTGTESVIRVGIDGEITTLADIIADSSVSISPDGKRVAYISDEQGYDDLYLMNVDGSEKVRLTINSGYSTCLNWPF